MAGFSDWLALASVFAATPEDAVMFAWFTALAGEGR